MGLDTSFLKPGQTLIGYPKYNFYDVTIQKYKTQTKQVEST